MPYTSTKTFPNQFQDNCPLFKTFTSILSRPVALNLLFYKDLLLAGAGIDVAKTKVFNDDS